MKKIYIQPIGYRTPSNANWSYRYFAIFTESNNTLDLHHVISVSFQDTQDIVRIIEKNTDIKTIVIRGFQNKIVEKDFNKAWFTSNATESEILNIIKSIN